MEPLVRDIDHIAEEGIYPNIDNSNFLIINKGHRFNSGATDLPEIRFFPFDFASKDWTRNFRANRPMTWFIW